MYFYVAVEDPELYSVPLLPQVHYKLHYVGVQIFFMF